MELLLSAMKACKARAYNIFVFRLRTGGYAADPVAILTLTYSIFCAHIRDRSALAPL
jgi:hypothetical protein